MISESYVPFSLLSPVREGKGEGYFSKINDASHFSLDNGEEVQINSCRIFHLRNGHGVVLTTI
jgi:hypothetical protein